MEYTERPPIGSRVVMTSGKHGSVISYPKKPKHSDKVTVAKDGETGCNSSVMIKYSNLVPEEKSKHTYNIPAGCDHNWSDWKDAFHTNPPGGEKTLQMRQCTKCSLIETREVDDERSS